MVFQNSIGIPWLNVQNSGKPLKKRTKMHRNVEIANIYEQMVRLDDAHTPLHIKIMTL